MAYGRTLPALIALAHLIYVSNAEYVYYGCIRDDPRVRALPALTEASDKALLAPPTHPGSCDRAQQFAC